MSEKRELKVFIQDVFESIDAIHGYVSAVGDAQEFKQDKKTFDAVMRNFMIIGEAVKNIYEEVRVNYPNVEWRQIMAMRNLIAHEYWGVDEQVVWSAIQKNLPELKEVMVKIRDSLQ